MNQKPGPYDRKSVRRLMPWRCGAGAIYYELMDSENNKPIDPRGNWSGDRRLSSKIFSRILKYFGHTTDQKIRGCHLYDDVKIT